MVQLDLSQPEEQRLHSAKTEQSLPKEQVFEIGPTIRRIASVGWVAIKWTLIAIWALATIWALVGITGYHFPGLWEFVASFFSA